MKDEKNATLIQVGRENGIEVHCMGQTYANLPPGKVCDVEVRFTSGLLAGMKLIGFAVWERSGGGRNVTFPARQYSVNGERRAFALLRPTIETAAQEPIRALILAAVEAWEGEQQLTRTA